MHLGNKQQKYLYYYKFIIHINHANNIHFLIASLN